MKSNAKYTALEILDAAGFDNASEIFGKVKVRIGGIVGISKPDHKINIPEGTKEVDVIVGRELAVLKIE